jgi:acyl carrier protein
MYTAQEIRRIVKGYIGESVDLDNISEEVNIFEAGLVNSLFAIELMTFLEKSFDIKVGMDDLDMSYFRSINAITEFVSRKEAAKIP